MFLTGEYGGDETTDLIYLPFILKSWSRRYEFSFVVPFLHVEGPTGVFVGAGRGVQVASETSGKRESRSGPGDLLVRGEYFVVAGNLRSRPWLSVLGRVKIPTADENDGLGTGEFDWTVGVSYTQPLGRRLAGFLDISRKKVGDPPAQDFQDTTAVAAGASVRFTDRVSSYLFYDREDSILRELEDGESLNLGLSVRPGQDWRFQASIFIGLSDSREDFGAMVGMARTWDVPERPRP